MHQTYLKLMLENSPDIILFFNRNAQLVYCSNIFLELAHIEHFGLIEGCTLDKVYENLGDKTFVELALKRFEKLKSLHETITDTRVIDFSREGNHRNYSVKSTPIMDEAGNFEGALVIYRDITDLLRREADERIKVMFDTTPLACTFWDEGGNLLDCNQEALNLFEVPSKELFISRFYDFSPPFQSNGQLSSLKMQEYMQETYRTGRRQFEWLHCNDKGERLPVEVTLVRVPWREGCRVVGYTRNMRDIEEIEAKRREADARNQELEVQTRAAQVASETKSKFLATMSHEIRTPTNAIIGMSDLMRTDNLDETQRMFFKDIKKTSASLLQIINDILDISKIEAGKMELVPVHFNLLELYDNICSLSRFTAESKDLEWRHSFDPEVPHIIYGDDIRIRQVLTNVINNAIKYTKQGYVDFKVQRIFKHGRDYLVFTVEDTGIGIKKEDAPRLFERFHQVEDKASRGVLGTGLGLDITKSLLALMHGTIEFESEYGVGSVFTIMLPLIEGNPALVEGKHIGSRVIATNDTQVLVVDDNQINLKVALAFLITHNIHADTAESGSEALSMVQKKSYTLVFMDHMMPGMDGIETTRQIRQLEGEQFKTLPIIALTANVVVEAQERFWAGGINDFIAKPIDKGDLNRKLTKWLPQNRISHFETSFKTLDTHTKIYQNTLSASNWSSISTMVNDWEAGLNNIGGDESLYQQILRSFKDGHREDVEKIRDALHQGDQPRAYRLAHTLKSTLGLLGSSRVWSIAAELEKTLTEKDIPRAVRQLPNLQMEMNLLLKELENLSPKAPLIEPKSSTPDQNKILDIIGALQPLLVAGNTAALAFIEDIQKNFSALDGKGELLISQITDFEFSSALETLRGIKQAMV